MLDLKDAKRIAQDMMQGEFNLAEVALLEQAAVALDFGGVLEALKIVSWYGSIKTALLLNPSIEYTYAMTLVDNSEHMEILKRNPAFDLWTLAEQKEIERQDPSRDLLSELLGDAFKKE